MFNVRSCAKKLVITIVACGEKGEEIYIQPHLVGRGRTESQTKKEKKNGRMKEGCRCGRGWHVLVVGGDVVTQAG